MTQRLAGRNALITGGTRGIGLAIAVAYAREGAAVALLSRAPENLGNACETVLAKAEGARVTAVRAHVDNSRGWTDLFIHPPRRPRARGQ